MCPSPEELPKTEEATAPATTTEPSPEGAAQETVKETADVSAEPAFNSGTSTPKAWRPPVLVYTGFSIMLITFVVWVIFSWSGYADKYSQITEGWHLGSTKMIEITLVRDDKEGLACSSDLDFEGHRCGFGAGGRPLGAAGPDDAHTFRPYNTVRNELFVGSGLWDSKGLPVTLPKERFSVVCNYRVLGVAKSMALRWGPKASFDPLKQSVAVGSLTDCVIPQ